jgi:hypothetical protein
MDKDLGICMEVLNLIWNNFNVGKSFPISIDFELIKRFLGKLI